MLKFRGDFEAGICSAFCRWCLVEVMKLNLGRDSEARFGQDFEVKVLWRCWCLVEILKLMLVWKDEIRSRFVKDLVIWTQPSGRLFHLGWVWEWFCIFVGVLIFIFVSLASTLSPIFLTQFPLLVLCESDTPNWQRASHTNDSIWRPYLLSNKCNCLWSWEPWCNTLNHKKSKFKSPHPPLRISDASPGVYNLVWNSLSKY